MRRSKRKWSPMTKTQINNEKLLGMLGLAMRAGKLTAGTDRVCEEIKRNGHAGNYDDGEENGQNKKFHKNCGCVIVSSEASANTKKRITDACRHYSVNCYETDITLDELSFRIGKQGGISAVSVFDKGFASALCKIAETPLPKQQ